MVKLSNARKVKHCDGKVKVGYSKQLKMNVMCITITDWIVDYDRWYKLEGTEINDDNLLRERYNQVKEDYKSNRFLFSWRKNENTPEQASLLHSIIGDKNE